MIESGAEFSRDRVYRYRLWRIWSTGPRLAVIGLNPSTADETQDDPTVRRCIGYAHRWGFGGLEMLNLFGYRATNPRELRDCSMLHEHYINGPSNSSVLYQTAERVIATGGAVLCAWGNWGLLNNRWAEVGDGLTAYEIPAACLGLTAAGQPRHPLYLRNDAIPLAYLGDGGYLVTGS